MYVSVFSETELCTIMLSNKVSEIIYQQCAVIQLESARRGGGEEDHRGYFRTSIFVVYFFYRIQNFVDQVSIFNWAVYKARVC